MDDPSKPAYHGMLRWRISHKRIELTQNMTRRREIFCITFGRRGGTAETNLDCVRNFVAFIRVHGRLDQWNADGISQFHQELWKAAVAVWGFPIWSQEQLQDDLSVP